MSTILLGTVALEPNRWGTVDPSRRATISLADWLPGIAAAGFDGIELWDGHLDDDDDVVDGPLPIVVFNSYVSFDDADPTARTGVARQVRRCASRGVKFNVGNDPAHERAYADRLAAWVEVLPEGCAALCECHAGISIAEDPATAARLFEAAGSPARVQAIVHTHESADHLRARFDAYGDRITHVHVNHLDVARGRTPRLADIRADLEATVELIRRLGFTGTWTIEFVAGLLSADDHPTALLAQATEDVSVLRSVLA